MSNVMGLDLSTATGLACVTSAKKVRHSEQIQFKKLTGETRINSIAARILAQVEEQSPELVVIEDYAVGRFAGAAIVSISIGSVVRFLFWQNDIPFMVVSPTSLKRFVTGAGNAKKENMILEVYKRYGHTSATNDEADAIGLAMMGQAVLRPHLFTSLERAASADALKSNPTIAERISMKKLQ
jgi:crossover junction endodeoxyribonuclease RuvC